MATHSSILAWRIPRTEEPGGLLFIGSQRVGHDQCDLVCSPSVPTTTTWRGTNKFSEVLAMPITLIMMITS